MSYSAEDIAEEICNGNIHHFKDEITSEVAFELIDLGEAKNLALLPASIFTKKVLEKIYERNYKSIFSLPSEVYDNESLIKIMVKWDAEIVNKIPNFEQKYDLFKELLHINSDILYVDVAEKLINEENVLELIEIAPGKVNLMQHVVPVEEWEGVIDRMIAKIDNDKLDIKSANVVFTLGVYANSRQIIEVLKRNFKFLTSIREDKLVDVDVLNACFNDYRFNSRQINNYKMRQKVYEALVKGFRDETIKFEDFISKHSRHIDRDLWDTFSSSYSFIKLCEKNNVNVDSNSYSSKKFNFDDKIEIIEKSLGIRRKKVDDWDLEIDEIVEEICSGNIANIKKSCLTMDVAIRLVEDGESSFLSFFPEDFFTIKIIKELEQINNDCVFNLPAALYQDIKLIKQLVRINPDVIDYIEGLDQNYEFFKELLSINHEVLSTRSGKKFINKKTAYELLKIVPSEVKLFYDTLPERHWEEAIDIALSVNASPRAIHVGAANQKQVSAFLKKNLDFFNFFGQDKVGDIKVLTGILNDQRIERFFNEKTKRNVMNVLQSCFRDEKFTVKQFLSKYKGKIDGDLWESFQHSKSFIKMCAKAGLDPTTIKSEYNEHIREMLLVTKIKKIQQDIEPKTERVIRKKI